MYEKALNEDYIRASMDRAFALMDKATNKPGYNVDKEKCCLSMTKGAGEIKLDESLMYSAISQALKEGREELEFDTLSKTLVAPDFAKLYVTLPEKAPRIAWTKRVKSGSHNHMLTTFA